MASKTPGAVVITGASTGIGEATALYLDSMGFRVFAGVRKRADGARLRRRSDTITALTLDITRESSIKRAQQTVQRSVGAKGLVGLVNNAGIGVGGPVELLDLDDLRRQFEVNFFGHIAVTKAFLPQLRKASGRIVFTSSIGGRIAVPFMSPYNSSKFALEALADALRLELRHFGIMVSLVEPGSIATPIWDKAEKSSKDLETKAPPALAKLYREQMAAFNNARHETADSGIPPEEVAKKIHHAITAKKPKTRYLIGGDAKRNARGAWILSDKMMDRLKARELGF